MGANTGYLTAKNNTSSDEMYTPFYAVEPLLKYIDKDQTIWCPFDKEWSAFVRTFQENGNDVIYTHIDDGYDFFNYEPDNYDIIISNPPFSKKDNVLKRLYELNKPFALLLPLNSLQGKGRCEYFKDGLQILFFNQRIGFHKLDNMQTTLEGSPFASVYFCRDFLPRELIMEQIEKYDKPLIDNKKLFLYDHQLDAVNKASNGCIFNGGVGSGKSRAGLYYYFKENGGSLITYEDHVPMPNPQDLYIITTAKKRDGCEWECELANFYMSTDPTINPYNNKIVIDSWNNIGQYKFITNAFFIFDEDRVTGNGAWVNSFLILAKHNNWIILSATPGDTWMDYVPVFVANGFYKNKTAFTDEHVVYARYTKWPQIDKYIGISRLVRLRDKILINMDFERMTVPHHIKVDVLYNIVRYKEVIKTRWNPYKDEPIQQASGLCYVLRRLVNTDESRINALMDILDKQDTAIIFYNFDYELDMLHQLFWGPDNEDWASGFEVAEWNGHAHQEVPLSNKWVYLVQYTAGCEGWNCIRTDTIIFFSQNYSYKVVTQAAGRIDRLNSPFIDLYYYHFKSKASIDLAISRALDNKKKFNEGKWVNDKKPKLEDEIPDRFAI